MNLLSSERVMLVSVVFVDLPIPSFVGNIIYYNDGTTEIVECSDGRVKARITEE